MSLPTDPLNETLDPAFADYLLAVVAGALPDLDDASAEQARRTAIRVAFQAMRPRNPVQAMLAAEAITAHHVIMDCFRIALRSDTDPAAAARARSSAASLSRVRLAGLRMLEPQEEAPAPAAARPAPPARRKVAAVRRVEPPVETAQAPTPEPPQEPPPPEPPPYIPRDRFGNPIERWRWEDMTMAQRRAAFADPSDTNAREAALAEEEAAIVAQAADPTTPNPDPDAAPPPTPPPAAPC